LNNDTIFIINLPPYSSKPKKSFSTGYNLSPVEFSYTVNNPRFIFFSTAKHLEENEPASSEGQHLA